MSHYKIEIGKFNKPYGPKWYNVIYVSDKDLQFFIGKQFMSSEELMIATFQKDNTDNICVCITKPGITKEDKEKIKNAILEYFTYTESYTEKVKHESSKWVKPTYKTIRVEGEHETYGARWMEYEEKTVIDKPGHYEDDSWFEDVIKTKEIVPEFEITFENYY